MFEELQNEIVAELTMELSGEPDFSVDILTNKVKNAIREVRLRRNYAATSYTEKQIADDLANYYSVIKNVALYDYNQIGAEFQSNHNENSTSRSWTNRDALFGNVHAFVKIL